MAVIETVTISEKLFTELSKAYAKLAKLEAAGVDNWEGYEFAFGDDEEEDEDDES